MKVLVINPNTSTEMTESIAAMAEAFGGELDVDTVNVSYGPEFIDSHLDDTIAAVAVAEKVWETREAYDGFVIACFDDPGLQAARCATHKPVVGIAHAVSAFGIASGGRVGVLVAGPEVIGRAAEVLESSGLREEQLLFGSLGSTIAELSLNHDRYRTDFEATADELIAAGATSIVLACAGFSVYADDLARHCEVPILDGTACALLLRSQLALRAGGLWRVDPPATPSAFTGSRAPRPAWSA